MIASGVVVRGVTLIVLATVLLVVFSLAGTGCKGAEACFDEGYKDGRKFGSSNPYSTNVETYEFSEPWNCTSADDYFRGVQAGCRSTGATCWWDR